MQPETATKLQTLLNASLAGELIFPQLVQELQQLDVERYHADYSRHEITYYLTNGESLVLPTQHEQGAIAPTFSSQGVEAAVRQSQRGEHTYAEFVQKTMAAGCVGYFVQITGRQVLYFGRLGELHIERFPPQ